MKKIKYEEIYNLLPECEKRHFSTMSKRLPIVPCGYYIGSRRERKAIYIKDELLKALMERKTRRGAKSEKMIKNIIKILEEL